MQTPGKNPFSAPMISSKNESQKPVSKFLAPVLLVVFLLLILVGVAWRKSMLIRAAEERALQKNQRTLQESRNSRSIFDQNP